MKFLIDTFPTDKIPYKQPHVRTSRKPLSVQHRFKKCLFGQILELIYSRYNTIHNSTCKDITYTRGTITLFPGFSVRVAL